MNLEVNDLEFGYAKETILKGISFSVQKGERVSILGPNGAGKSTLLKCINGLLKPQKGLIMLGNEKTSKMKRIDLSKRFGYVPQASDGLFPLSVFDMVLLGRKPHMSWTSRAEDRQKALEALVQLKIEHLALKNYNELSGGQRQKVIIARALAQDTDFLLLDEATSNLDIKHQLQVMKLIERLSATKELTALMIVHDLNIAARWSDKIIMMNQNGIVAAGPPANVLTEDNICSVYEVRVRVRFEHNHPYIIPLKPLDEHLRIKSKKLTA